MTPPRTQSKKTSRAMSLSRAFVPLSLTISTPIARPRPRVSPTIERSSHSFTRFRALPPTRAARSGIRSRRMISIVTVAATHAAGCPPKVVPATTSPFPMDRSSPRTAPRGISPPPSALPIETRSGATPKCSIPHIFPVRPSPASTSSAMKNHPCSSASLRSPRTKFFGGIQTPASKATGSKIAPGKGLPVPSHPRREGAKRGRSDAEPVILSHEAEDQRPTARFNRVLDGPFRRAGAGQLEEDASQVVRRANRKEPLRDVDHREMRIHEEDEEAVALECVHRRLQDLRMDVPEVVRRPLAREVDVLLAFDVIQEGALRGRDHDVRELRVVGPEVLRIEFGLALPIPVRGAPRTDRRPRPFLGHLRRERPSGHTAFGGGVYEAR